MNSTRDSQRLTLRIHIPKRVRHRSHYVSPLTQSLALSVAPAAHCATCSGPVSADVGLTPGSPNCTAISNGTTCTIAMRLSRGNYVGTIATYDGPVGCQSTSTCNILSRNQSFPLPIVAGKQNAPTISLYGVPKYLKAEPLTKFVSVSQPLLFYPPEVFLAGVGTTSKVALYATDADGGLILGPGSPTFSLPDPPPLGLTMALTSNVVTFTTPSAFHTTLNTAIHVNVNSQSCTAGGATCSFLIYPRVGVLLAVADPVNSAVRVVFGDPARQELDTYATITNGINHPDDVAFNDVDGDLFVANHDSSTITIYAPPYTGAPIKTISTPPYPTHIALDRSGNLAVAIISLGFFVNVYSAPAYGSPQTISPPADAKSLAFDYTKPSPSLWMAATGHVVRYAYPYTGAASPDLSLTNPSGVDVDKNGNIYVTDSTNGTLTQYTSGSWSSGLTTGSIVQPTRVNYALAGVAVCSTGAAAEYSQAYGSTFTLNWAWNTQGQPCLLAGDYRDADDFAVPSPPYTLLVAGADDRGFAGALGYVPFAVGAMAAYPSNRWGN